MKTIFIHAIFLILLGITQNSYGQFTLKTDKETIDVNAGESATFNISFTVQKGFDASISLSVSTGNLMLQGGSGVLSSTIINEPYNSVQLTVTSKANFTKSGLYEFIVTGSNTSIFSSVVCHVNVIETPRTNWRVMQQSLGYLGVPRFIVQDSHENYWYQFHHVPLQYASKNTPIDNWELLQTDFEETDIVPVSDSKNNRLWLSINRDLIKFTLDNNYKTIYNSQNSSLNVIPRTLAIDNLSGALWACGNYGVLRLVGAEWTLFDSTNSNLEKESILGLAVGGSNVWVGTHNGILKFDGSKWVRYVPPIAGTTNIIVKVLAAEPNGDVWVGLSRSATTSNSNELFSMIGLAKFDGTSWKMFDSTNCPIHKDNYINSVAIDKKGNKWFATASHSLGTHDGYKGGSGILKYDNTEWTAYTKDNSPLPDNKINWIGVDNNDNVWFHQFIEEDDLNTNFWGVFNENGLPPFLAPPTGVEEQPEATEGGIALYPNPTNTTFTISGADNITSVKIMNSLGIMVNGQRLMVNGQLNVDVSDLATGLYFVQLRTPTGVITKSIVVSR